MSALIAFADIDAEYAKDALLLPTDVALLEEWQRAQPHLPAPLHHIETALALQSSGYSIEAAKRRIDAFYTYRLHCPEFFAQRDPSGVEVQTALNTWLMVVLPQLTPDGYLVNYVRLQNRNPNVFNYNATIKMADMITCLTYRQTGCGRGLVFVVDLEGLTMGHLFRSDVVSIRKSLTYMQNAAPVKIVSFHFINGVPFMDKLLALLRPFLGVEFRNVLHVHYGDNATIFKFVPRRILPVESGGTEFSATDYYTNHIRKNVEKHAEYYKREEQQRIDESKRPDKNDLNLDDLFGVEGTFKKLNVD